MSLPCSVLKSKQCEITQDFKGVGVHAGIDIVGPGYTLDNIVAMEDGIVSEATWCNSRGNFVRINHENGYSTEYCHMENYSVAVKTGQRVLKGQKLGYMGSTGNSSGGHLDCKVIYGGYNDYIDPTPYVLNKQSFMVTYPKSVDRDTNKRQFEVDYSDTLSIRKTPAKNGIKYEKTLSKGIYNFIDTKVASGYTWVKIADNMWCACTDMSRILEIETKEDEKIIEELKQKIEEQKKIIIEQQDKITSLQKQINNYNDDEKEYKQFIVPKTDKYFINLKEKEILKYKRS